MIASPRREGTAELLRVGLLSGGLGLAAAVRMLLAGHAGAASIPAGLTFAVALIALAALGAPEIGWRPRSGDATVAAAAGAVTAGLAGLALLCVVPLWLHGAPGHPGSVGRFAAWAPAVALVAVAEEVLLRGALWAALARLSGDGTALLFTAVLFALVHLPFYGLGALPLDLAVGFLLGALRLVTGGVAAPAFAHAGADLAGWWLL